MNVEYKERTQITPYLVFKIKGGQTVTVYPYWGPTNYTDEDALRALVDYTREIRVYDIYGGGVEVDFYRQSNEGQGYIEKFLTIPAPNKTLLKMLGNEFSVHKKEVVRKVWVYLTK